MLGLLVALPLVGLVATAVSPGPVARADEAAVSVSPGKAATARTPKPAPSASSSAAPEPTATTKVSRKVATLPVEVRIPDRGSGRFRTAPVKGPVIGKKGRLLRYAVRVERELPFDPARVAREAEEVLSDRRSWARSGQWRMQLVDDVDRAQVTILVATPKTTDTYCLPLRTWGRLSCQDGPRVVLNARRWAFGASAYGRDVAGYRTYLVNHEIGHVLGFGHERCTRSGARAPVMLQQTKGLQGCRKNSWPFPRA